MNAFPIKWLTPFCLGMTISAYFFYIIPKLHESTPLSDTNQALFPSYHPLLEYNDDYETALLRLRCFTSPGCFPSINCKSGKPQKIKREKIPEEQSFCVDDLQRHPERNNQKCLVYSFGVWNSYEWEAKVASMFGCEVFAFDPTITLPSNPAPGVTFHQLGLQGADTNMSVTHGDSYQAIEQHRLLSLEQIRRKLGHEKRFIDVLMLDCEGCEWGVLRQLVCRGTETHYVKQIMTEFHFQKNLGLHDEQHVMIAAEAVSCLEKDRWGATSVERVGAGPKDLEYFRGVTSIFEHFNLLMTMSLRRIPMDEKLPHEVLDEEANTLRIEAFKATEYEKNYGADRTKWPGDFAEFSRKREEAAVASQKVVETRRSFDQNGYFVHQED